MDNTDFKNIIDSLTKELDTCDESINRIKDEINTKRRNITELQTKQNNIREKIKAKRYEMLESIISDKLEMSIDELAGAVQSGDVLVEKTKPENPVLSETQNEINLQGDNKK